MPNAVLFTLFYFYVSTAADPTSSSNSISNSTVSQTYSDHGNPNLVCRPGKWPDVLAFFLLNYFTHAATIKTLPGENTPITILNILAALFFPASGVFRAYEALKWCAKLLGQTELETAARAGALCTVIQWPVTRDSRPQPPPIWSLLKTSIHGSYTLPDGYILAVVPGDSKFEDSPTQLSHWRIIFDAFCSAKHGKTKISFSYSTVKILVAVIQLLYASATMYLSRGDQVNWYGYSAFGLTVAPYAWMSFINLCANLMCPEYPSMYLVESETLKTLRDGQNGVPGLSFDGVVGKLDPSSETKLADNISKLARVSPSRGKHPLWRRTKLFFDLFVPTGVAVLVPIAIIGSISRFRSGSHITAAQQVSVTLWLLYGVYFGVLSRQLLRVFEERPILNCWAMGQRAKAARLLVILTFLLGFNAVFGFIHVGQMIVAYGVCISVS